MTISSLAWECFKKLATVTEEQGHLSSRDFFLSVQLLRTEGAAVCEVSVSETDKN